MPLIRPQCWVVILMVFPEIFWDIETDSEVYKKGIYLKDAISENQSPEAVYNKVYQTTKELLNTNQFLTFLGGEHSISIGIIKAFYEKYKELTVSTSYMFAPTGTYILQ